MRSRYGYFRVEGEGPFPKARRRCVLWVTSFLGRVFATMQTLQRRPVPAKHGHSAKRPSLSAKWRSLPANWYRLPVAVLLAVVAGTVSYSLIPSAAIAPVADRLSPQVFAASALGNLLGQGQVSTDGTMPAPLVTATAKASTATHAA